MIRITELSLPIDHSADQLRQAIIKRLKIAEEGLRNFVGLSAAMTRVRKTAMCCSLSMLSM
jgi:hypothetical protein